MSEVDFAARLNRLFELVPGPDGRPFSNEAVIAGLAEHGGPTISKGYLSELRSGKKDNPTLRHIEALAAFFGVDPAYFVADQDRADEIAEQISTLKALGDAGVQSIALRAADASPESRDLIAAMIDQIIKHERSDDEQRGKAAEQQDRAAIQLRNLQHRFRQESTRLEETIDRMRRLPRVKGNLLAANEGRLRKLRLRYEERIREIEQSKSLSSQREAIMVLIVEVAR